jgi:hypothetical protein
MMIGLQAQAGLLFVEAGSEFTFSGGPKYSGENCVEIFDTEKDRPLDLAVPLCLQLRSSTVQVVLHTGPQAMPQLGVCC